MSQQRPSRLSPRTLLRARGFGHVVDAWEGEIERVKAFRFEGTSKLPNALS